MLKLLKLKANYAALHYSKILGHRIWTLTTAANCETATEKQTYALQHTLAIRGDYVLENPSEW
jgi:hypothetical protein